MVSMVGSGLCLRKVIIGSSGGTPRLASHGFIAGPSKLREVDYVLIRAARAFSNVKPFFSFPLSTQTFAHRLIHHPALRRVARTCAFLYHRLKLPAQIFLGVGMFQSIGSKARGD